MPDRAHRVGMHPVTLRASPQQRTRSVPRGVTTQSVGTIRVTSGTPIMPMHPSLAATTDYCGRRLAGDAFLERPISD